jgi:DNA-binding GntR family transcriptional regulator
MLLPEEARRPGAALYIRLAAMPTIAHQIYKALAEQIINGEFAPGDKLEEKILAERFNASRTPVREALRELAAKGLVDLVPRRGGVVASIGVDELADLLEAEAELEALCARMAAQRMSMLEKKQLEQLHADATLLAESGDEAGYLEANTRFHDLICAGTRNKTLAQTVRRLRERLAPFRQTQSGVERRFEVSHDEHKAVVGAILAGNGEAAAQAMLEHNVRLSTNALRRVREGKH